MKKKIKSLFLSSITVFSLFSGVALVPASSVLAQSTPGGAICEGIGGATGGSEDCSDTPGAASVNSTIASVVNVLSIFLGVAGVIMIMIGGFKYITSGGDSGKVSSAKNTIIYAVIGLIVALLAQILVKFVIGKTQGA